MKPDNSEATNDTLIREQPDDWAEAVRAKMWRRLCPTMRRTSCCSTSRPRFKEGRRCLSKQLGGVVHHLPGSGGYEITELSITSADDVAFWHSLNRIYGARTTGEQTDVWVRATVGLRKRDGTWTITHEHYSVPFYMQPPYKASLDLKP